MLFSELKEYMLFITNEETFPLEFTVHTSKLVQIEHVEKTISQLVFHASPKGWFAL